VLVLFLRAAVAATSLVRAHAGVHRLHAFLHLGVAFSARRRAFRPLTLLGHRAARSGAGLARPVLMAGIGHERSGAERGGGGG